jgi:hypothetical protein
VLLKEGPPVVVRDSYIHTYHNEEPHDPGDRLSATTCLLGNENGNRSPAISPYGCAGGEIQWTGPEAPTKYRSSLMCQPRLPIFRLTHVLDKLGDRPTVGCRSSGGIRR